ncbi:hypothetical protein M404DRAFT_36856 [Pisolithus tinctorius Marx 270]|uniref:Uncharacterized protein n=1 Tax=Pisolithus tinctorius Marx 270 TaxID=870435 RepID=A0A0C3I633_PISTI|nr:hypothetical protein M404DRAFT_36856 [Pisolithus tinctorius Marx 270]
MTTRPCAKVPVISITPNHHYVPLDRPHSPQTQLRAYSDHSTATPTALAVPLYPCVTLELFRQPSNPYCTASLYCISDNLVQHPGPLSVTPPSVSLGTICVGTACCSTPRYPQNPSQPF